MRHLHSASKASGMEVPGADRRHKAQAVGASLRPSGREAPVAPLFRSPCRSPSLTSENSPFTTRPPTTPWFYSEVIKKKSVLTHELAALSAFPPQEIMARSVARGRVWSLIRIC